MLFRTVDFQSPDRVSLRGGIQQRWPGGGVGRLAAGQSEAASEDVAEHLCRAFPDRADLRQYGEERTPPDVSSDSVLRQWEREAGGWGWAVQRAREAADKRLTTSTITTGCDPPRTLRGASDMLRLRPQGRAKKAELPVMRDMSVGEAGIGLQCGSRDSWALTIRAEVRSFSVGCRPAARPTAPEATFQRRFRCPASRVQPRNAPSWAVMGPNSASKLAKHDPTHETNAKQVCQRDPQVVYDRGFVQR